MLVRFLLLGLLAWSQAGFALDCTSLWRAGFPDQGRRRTSFECTEVFVGRSNVNLYYSQEVSTRSRRGEVMETLKAALEKSFDEYSRMGDMPPVKAVLYHRPFFGDAGTSVTYASAITEFPARREACPVIVYPAAFDFSMDYLKQLVAHELFHCFQWKNYRGRTTLGTSRGIGTWWLEGTAQFMSNYVYPRVDMEYDTNFFDPYDPRTPITEQAGYGLVHFFQSYFNQVGRDTQKIKRFMRNMPSSASGNQVRALREIRDMKHIFHKFAQTMTIPNLIDSSGDEAPLGPIAPMDIIDLPPVGVPFTRTFQIKPFTIHNVYAIFKRGQKYSIKAEGSDRVKISLRHSDEDAWRELPTTIETPCDLDESYEILMTASASRLDEKEITVTIESETSTVDCPCTSTVVDQCLVGSWEMDPTTMRNFFTRMLAGRGTITKFEGFERGTIDANGRMNGVMQWLGEGSGGMGAYSAFVKMKMEATTVLDMFKQENGKLCVQQIDRDFSGEMTVTTRGRTMVIPIEDRGPFGGRSDITYTCNAREFVMKTAMDNGSGGSIELLWRFLRQ